MLEQCVSIQYGLAAAEPWNQIEKEIISGVTTLAPLWDQIIPEWHDTTGKCRYTFCKSPWETCVHNFVIFTWTTKLPLIIWWKSQIPTQWTQNNFAHFAGTNVLFLQNRRTSDHKVVTQVTMGEYETHMEGAATTLCSEWRSVLPNQIQKAIRSPRSLI